MYGIHIQTMQNRYVLLSQKALEGFSIARVAGRYWVEHFPILRLLPSWFPGSAARRLGNLYKPFCQATRNELYEKIKEDVVSHQQYLGEFILTLALSVERHSAKFYCTHSDPGTLRKARRHRRCRVARPDRQRRNRHWLCRLVIVQVE